MNWDAIGAAAELIGALAVIASLVYLALQIRQNSASVKAAAVQSVLENLNSSLQVGAASKETAKVIVKGQIEFDSLEEEEKYQFALWAISFFRSLELAHQHYRNGNITDSTWKGMEFQAISLLQSDPIQSIWEARKGIYGAEFQEFVDRIKGIEGGISVQKARDIVFNENTSPESE